MLAGAGIFALKVIAWRLRAGCIIAACTYPNIRRALRDPAAGGHQNPKQQPRPYLRLVASDRHRWMP